MEEELIAGLCALDEPVHRVDDVDLRRMAARVVVILRQDADVIFPISVSCKTAAEDQGEFLPPAWSRDEAGRRTQEEMVDGTRVVRRATELGPAISEVGHSDLFGVTFRDQTTTTTTTIEVSTHTECPLPPSAP